MTTNLNSGSATIYEFPLRGRFAPSARRDDADTAANSLRATKVAYSGAWYHDAAIQDADRVTKN